MDLSPIGVLGPGFRSCLYGGSFLVEKFLMVVRFLQVLVTKGELLLFVNAGFY